MKARPQESPSSLETMLGCSLKWSLRYTAKAWPGNSDELPTQSLLQGSFIHELIAQLMQLPSLLPPAEGAQFVADLFDREGPAMAAEYFLPGAELERAELKEIAVKAARELLSQMHKYKMQVLRVELPKAKSAPNGFKVEGTPDLVVGNPAAIIDLKLGSKSKRVGQLESGTALQLATYAWLEKGEAAQWPAVAYFILSKQSLIASDAARFPGAEHISGTIPSETWQATVNGHAAVWKDIKNGDLAAAGVVDENFDPPRKKDEIDGDTLLLKPPCFYCEYKSLCGLAYGGSA
jgi:ATP-dependent helicase/DNAse subunit B